MTHILEEAVEWTEDWAGSVAAVMPPALRGVDICASAVTGSGKTAAFILPALERLVLDKTALMVQQLARGERLSLNAVDFSEVDATLMGQLLLQNFALGCIDLGGSKPLPKEIKVLSDAFARCRFPLRELSVQ